MATVSLKKIFLYICISFSIIFAKELKVVSLAPGFTYQLYKLKRGGAIVANTTYCKLPPAAQNKTKIGSVVNINVEKIYALRPDLVISSTLTRKNQIEKLRQLGIQVKIFQRSNIYSDIMKQYLEIAKLVERKKLAHRQLDSINTIINRIKQKIKHRKSRRIFFQIGSDPLYAANRSSFINDLINFANCENIIETE